MARLCRRVTNLLFLLQEVVLQLIFLLNLVNMRRALHHNRRARLPRMITYKMSDNNEDRVKYMSSLLGRSDEVCFAKLRMDRDTFSRLCFILEYCGGLIDSKYVSFLEKVAIFLTVLAHHTKLQCVKFDFKRSGETVSKQFHSVLDAMLRLHDVLLAKSEVVDETNTHRRWKWFKGCIGALDGSYVLVTVSQADKPRLGGLGCGL